MAVTTSVYDRMLDRLMRSLGGDPEAQFQARASTAMQPGMMSVLDLAMRKLGGTDPNAGLSNAEILDRLSPSWRWQPTMSDVMPGVMDRLPRASASLDEGILRQPFDAEADPGMERRGGVQPSYMGDARMMPAGGVDLTPQPPRDDWTQYRQRPPWGTPPTEAMPPTAGRGPVRPGRDGLMNPNEIPSTERGGSGQPFELQGGMAWDRNPAMREALGLQGTARVPLPGDAALDLYGGYQWGSRGPVLKAPWNVGARVRIPF